MPAISLGSALNLAAATRTLTAAQLLSLAWRRGNPPYTDGAAFPWGRPTLANPAMQWMASYLTTQASFVPDAPQDDYPAWASLPNEAEVYGNGDAIALLGGSPFSVVGKQLVIQPRPITAAEAATLAATPFLTDRTWVSGACVTAPYSQAGGYFSVTARLPKMGPGLWPAFWLLPVSGAWPPEIDILEAVAPGGAVRMTTSVHTTDAAWNAAHEQTVVVPVGFDPSAGFHEYGVLVDDHVTTFFDRVAVRSVPTPADLVGSPLYLLLDYAIGGVGSWPGPLLTGTKTVPPLVVSDVGAWIGTISAGAAPSARAHVVAAQAHLAAAVKLLP